MSTINPNATKIVPPTVIDLKQRSDAWFAYRLEHIGSSETPIILYQSFWDTPFSLFLKKTGQKNGNKDNRATDHGHANEGFAREWYTQETGNFVTPAVLEMAAWPEWMLFDDWDHLTPNVLSWSGDGYSKKFSLAVEIKCPFELEGHLEALEGKVPDEYWGQVQQALLVSGAGKLHYVSYYPEHKTPGVILTVTLDRDWVATQMLPALDKFWGWVKNKEFPIPKGEQTCTGDAEVALAEDARVAFAMWKEGERRYQQAKAKLMKFCGPYAKPHCGKIDIIQSFRKGYSYQADVSPTITLSIKRLE